MSVWNRLAKPTERQLTFPPVGGGDVPEVGCNYAACGEKRGHTI